MEVLDLDLVRLQLQMVLIVSSHQLLHLVVVEDHLIHQIFLQRVVDQEAAVPETEIQVEHLLMEEQLHKVLQVAEQDTEVMVVMAIQVIGVALVAAAVLVVLVKMVQE